MNPGDLFEKTVVGVLLFSFAGAVFPVLYKPVAQDVVTATADPFSPLLHAAAYVLAPVLAWRSGRLKNVIPPISILALLGLSAASLIWSTARTDSLRTWILLAASAAFASYFARRFSPSEQLTLMAWVLGACMILSVVFALFLPDLGIDRGIQAGRWRGAFSRKNTLGLTMTLSVIVFLTKAVLSRRARPIWLILGAFATTLALMSRSATAVLTCALVPFFLILARSLSTRMRSRVFLRLAMVLAAAGVLVYWVGGFEGVLNLLGRDATLTGRTLLWGLVLEKILEHPVFGYGIGAFWSTTGELYANIWSSLGWAAPHAHNGLLDVALDLGLVGVAVFTVGFAVECAKAVGNLRRLGRSAAALWPAVFLMYFFVLNASDTHILRHTSFVWLLYVIAVAQIDQARQDTIAQDYA